MSANENPNPPAAPTGPGPASAVVPALINQMRSQVVGVGVAFLILSLAFDFYVFRHNNKLRMQRDALKKQNSQLADEETRLLPVINDLAAYTQSQRPQLLELFRRNGIQLATPTNQPAPAR